MDHRAPAEEGVPVGRRLMDVLQRILERDGPRVLGVILTGSRARGMATRWSDYARTD